MQSIILSIAHVWDFVDSGLGIFHPSDNYHLYPVFIVLLLWTTVFSFFGRIQECIRLCHAAAYSVPHFFWLFLQSFWRYLLAGGLAYILPLLFWWSVSSIPDQLPLWRTPSNNLILGAVGATGLYNTLAYTIHFLVLLFVIQLIFAFYVQPYFTRLTEQYLRARRPDDIQIFNFSVALGRLTQSIYLSLFVICVLLSNWSTTALAFSWILAGRQLSNGLLFTLFGISADELIRRPFKKVRFVALLSATLYGVVFAYLWFVYNADRSNQYLELFALFTLWVTIDSVLTSLMTLIDPSRDTFFLKSAPVRLVLALPLITLATLLGSSNAFPWLNLPNNLWLIAGAGGAVYALFTPLIDTVRRVDSAQRGPEIEVTIFRRVMHNTVARFFKVGIRIGVLYSRFLLAPFEEDRDSTQVGKVIDSTGADVTDLVEFEESQSLVEEADEVIDTVTQVFGDIYEEGRVSGGAALPPDDSSSSDMSTTQSALRKFQSLAFPTYWIFLIALLVYQLYSKGVYTSISTSSLHLGSLSLSLNSVTGIFSLLNLLFGLGFPKPVKYFSGFLLLFTLSVLLMLSAVTSSGGLFGIHNDQLAEFLDLSAVLLLVGHVLYLLKVLFLLMRGDLR